jgi:hypothetical protein
MIKRYGSKYLSIPAIIKHYSWLQQGFVTPHNPKVAASNPASPNKTPCNRDDGRGFCWGRREENLQVEVYGN